MKKAKQFLGILLLVLVLALMATAIVGCSSSPATSPGETPDGGGAIAPNDSIVRAQVNAFRDSTSGYPQELEVRIVSSQDVEGLANPTKSKVDWVITVVTDEDFSSIEQILGCFIDAHIKQVKGEKGPLYYIYDIKLPQD